ncbi:hypothetical protein P8C59_004388 [Phyllachora maydis]|uniref:BTB domain-containing protein n=1 Tax=Phyllachora maydis TaxID=1825666 RepID=A0AAD9MB91_9PEZI|nr:hypothetical protein P8C59_004388 [Phyllachora maydis]
MASSVLHRVAAHAAPRDNSWFSGPMVVVLVGPEEKQWTLHLEMISRHSGYFRELLEASRAEKQEDEPCETLVQSPREEQAQQHRSTTLTLKQVEAPARWPAENKWPLMWKEQRAATNELGQVEHTFETTAVIDKGQKSSAEPPEVVEAAREQHTEPEKARDGAVAATNGHATNSPATITAQVKKRAREQDEEESTSAKRLKPAGPSRTGSAHTAGPEKYPAPTATPPALRTPAAPKLCPTTPAPDTQSDPPRNEIVLKTKQLTTASLAPKAEPSPTPPLYTPVPSPTPAALIDLVIKLPDVRAAVFKLMVHWVYAFEMRLSATGPAPSPAAEHFLPPLTADRTPRDYIDLYLLAAALRMRALGDAATDALHAWYRADKAAPRTRYPAPADVAYAFAHTAPGCGLRHLLATVALFFVFSAEWRDTGLPPGWREMVEGSGEIAWALVDGVSRFNWIIGKTTTPLHFAKKETFHMPQETAAAEQPAPGPDPDSDMMDEPVITATVVKASARKGTPQATTGSNATRASKDVAKTTVAPAHRRSGHAVKNEPRG